MEKHYDNFSHFILRTLKTVIKHQQRLNLRPV